jgi:hypothetical protein
MFHQSKYFKHLGRLLLTYPIQIHRDHFQNQREI